MTGILDFVQQTHNFIASAQNCRRTTMVLTDSRSWQTGSDRLIDGPPEDGTDFASYAAGASPHLTLSDRSRMVVACHADHACARADRSSREAAMRVLHAVPRCPDAAGSDHPDSGRAD